MSGVEWGKYQDAYKAIHDAIRSGLVAAPNGKKVTKIVFGEDANGNVREIKFYQDIEPLFTLTFSNSGPVVSSWDIVRS